MLTCEDDYDRAYQRWEDRDKKGKEPEGCKRKFVKSLAYFEKFMEKFPKNNSYPTVLMQTSFIYMQQLKDEDAYKLWSELVEKFSNHGLAGQAYLRIGEYHYNNRKNSDAIKAYKSALESGGLKGKNSAQLIYHMAEAYNNLGDFEEAAKWFFEYITGADQNKYPADLRQEALSYMAGAFADMDNGIDVANEFLSERKVVFEDTLYFEIGMKNLTRDRLEEAAYSFKRLLELNPVYVDAPIAHVKMITILEEKQKWDEAQAARKEVVKKYDNTSDWYKTNQSNQEAIKEAKRAIRGAYFQIPAYHHRRADKMDKAGDVEAGKAEYILALGAYDKFLEVYSEYHWDHYKVHTFKSVVYGAINDHQNQATMLNWIADVDTVAFGRKPKGYVVNLKKPDAAYNAVIAMDKYRNEGLKSVGDDHKKAYHLPQTKAYLAQVEKYLGSYGSDPKNADAAELAFNAALVHYDAEEYSTSVKVLEHLKKVYPTHKYIKEIMGNLAKSYTQAGMLEQAEGEYENLLKVYTPQDTMYVAVERSIAAVQFQKAEKLMKSKQFDKAAVAYLALQKRFPRMVFSDKAIFEAGFAYEEGKNYKKAAETYLALHKSYGKSELAVKSILKAASAYKKLKDYKTAGETFLTVTKAYPKDSMAFKAIGFAGSTYDSIPNKKLAAETFELAYTLYNKHPETPSYMYTACRTYEDGKLLDDAIRCNKIIIKDFAKSSFAIEAGFSIPKAFEQVKKWKEAGDAYSAFIKQFADEDPAKYIAANYYAATNFTKVEDVENANVYWQGTTDAFDKHGAKINADPRFPAEAAFNLGVFEKAKMDAFEMKGNDKAKAKIQKKLTDVLQKSMGLLAKSATYNSDKWVFKATNEMGYLFVKLAQKVREQEFVGKEDEVFAGKIGMVQTLPTFYDQAMPLFQKNIDVAREQGYYNKDVIEAELGYVEMFFQNGATFEELGGAFMDAPVPDISGVPEDAIIDELYGMGFEDSVIDNGNPYELWSDHYKGTLEEKGTAAAEGGVPKYEQCIKASEFYGIKNEWTDKCIERLGDLNPESEAMAIKIEKYDASNLFQDKLYFANKTRIEQIFGNTVMSENEKVKVFEEMINAAKSLTSGLEAKFKELDLKLNPPLGPDGKPLPAGAAATSAK